MQPQAISSVGATLRASSPDFSSLSPDELDQLELVLQRQVLTEYEQNERLAGLRRTMLHLEQSIHNEQPRSGFFSSIIHPYSLSTQQNRSITKSSDVTQCYICLSTIENRSIGSPPVLCADCHRPICRRCGNYTSPELVPSSYETNYENATHSSKWRCRMCIVRREVIRKSGTWNMSDEQTPSHSPVRLLQKLVAYRASNSLFAASPPGSSENENKSSSTLPESTNFFRRLWRSPTRQPAATPPSLPSTPPTLLTSHESYTIIDQLPKSCPETLDASPNLTTAPSKSNRRMSLIRNIPHKTSASNQSSPQSPATSFMTANPMLEKQTTKSSTITDPSCEDTTSVQTLDTSEFLSQNVERNNNNSNVGILDHSYTNQDLCEHTLTNIEQNEQSDLVPDLTMSNILPLSSIPMRITKQHHSDSLPSPDTSVDVSAAMDYFSASTLTKQSTTSSTEPLLVDNVSASVDIPITDNSTTRRRGSRSSLKSSDSWARKRALMHRGFEWNTTLDRENSMKANRRTERHDISNKIKSLPSSVTNSSTNTNQKERSTSNAICPSHLMRQQYSSRRLPPIPIDGEFSINSSNNDTIGDDITITSSSHSSTEYPYHSMRENSLSNRSIRSKSIDSESSSKNRSVHSKLSHTHQTVNAKSIDASHLSRQKSFLTVNNPLVPQRSLDYPCIVRKGPDLSDIVRRRMLYTKISKPQGDNFSISLEREHVPKVPRKIIIKKDNSIEIALSKPPKLRRHTLSEDYYGNCNPENEFSLVPSPVCSSTLGLPITLSIMGSTTGDRRKTIETCENIYLHAEENSKLRARTPPSNPHRILLHRDKNDKSIRTNGLGMRIVGGQECEDGSLGCFVTSVIPGGPADVQGNIEVGDQILEFNGNSLIDSTYEEVRMLQDQCGDIVQLFVQHNNIRLQINGGSALSSMEISRHFETVPRLASSLTRKRRNLPPLPSSMSSTFPKQPKRQLYETVETLEVPNVKELKPILINRGRLLAQLWHDIDDMKLALTIIQATNLPLRPNGDQPYAFIAGKMLFEDRGFDIFETKVIHSSNPAFNETFVFHEIEAIDTLNLEMILWDKKQNLKTNINSVHNTINNNNSNNTDDTDEFIGIIQLPLEEANLEDEPRWYELRDRQPRKSSSSSVTFKSSSGDIRGSFRKMTPSSKASKQERTKSSSDILAYDLNYAGINKSDMPSQPKISKRKHSVVEFHTQTFNKNSLQRASISGSMSPSMSKANHDDDNDEYDDMDDSDRKRHESRRQSAMSMQSDKLKRRISKGILKFFDNRTRRFSESTSKSLPQSPLSKKLSTQIGIDNEKENQNDITTLSSIDNSIIAINRLLRPNIVSTIQVDDQQQIPTIQQLQQMPIGQLMLPYIPSSRHSSISGSRKSSAASYCESDDDIDRYFTLSEQQEINEDSNVQTHTVGPGQVPPRNYENMINDFIHVGQIQLGLIVTKGLLEIDVICAKDLQNITVDHTTNENHPPDTYVKTYLRTGTRRVQKRKTSIVKASYNPTYQSKLKYNACNIMGRRLQVTVWQRARKFEKNQCIGEVFIQLDNLTLTQLTIAWYKLFRENLVESEFYDSS